MSTDPYLQTSGSNHVLFPVGSDDLASLTAGALATLPDALPTGSEFIAAMTVNVVSGGASMSALPNVLQATISFVILRVYWGRAFAILFWNGKSWTELPVTVLYWDPKLNGYGGWVVNPAASALTNMTDARVVAMSDATGLFVLAAR